LYDAVAALQAPELATVEHVRRNLQAFRHYAEAMTILRTSHLGAFRGGTLLSACLAYYHPGRTALLFVPALEGRPHLAPIVRDLLAAQADAAATRDLYLLQVTLEPDRTETEALLQQAGFVRLADLIYLECPVTPPQLAPKAHDLTWLAYERATRELFSRTIEQTYIDSLDCPALVGKRTIQDVLAEHQGASRGDTRHWYLACRQDRPLAVLLLATGSKQRHAEIVYMGVVPQARGQRLGRAVLGHANLTAFRAGAEILSLAVDADNTPALNMYRDFGFSQTTQRRAWVLFPGDKK
jgi:ribosomal protein S18 acetylase RimI-like enzyme